MLIQIYQVEPPRVPNIITNNANCVDSMTTHAYIRLKDCSSTHSLGKCFTNSIFLTLLTCPSLCNVLRSFLTIQNSNLSANIGMTLF